MLDSVVFKTKKFFREHKYLSFAYKKLVDIYYLYKIKYPRSYKNWIKKSESFSYLSETVDVENTFFVLIDCNNYQLNEEQLLANQLASIAKQNYSNKKIVIINNEALNIDYPDIEMECFSNAQELEIRDGAWVLPLHKDVVLSQHCLAELNYFIECSKTKGVNFDVVYSDIDSVDDKGRRKNPFFFPDWNPDFFLVNNYFSKGFAIKWHANWKEQHIDSEEICYRRILNSLSTPWHNVNVGHCAAILFHNLGAQPHLSKDMINLAENTLAIEADVKESAHVKFNWPLLDSPKVTLIVPTRNGYDILKNAIDSIVEKTLYPNFDILIINNQSDCQKTIAFMEELSARDNISILDYDFEFNYSAINNYAVKQAKGDLIAFVNNDIEVISGNWLSEMVMHAVRPDIGCVGAKLLYPNETIQHAGVVIGLWGGAGHSHKMYSRHSNGYMDRLQLVQNYSAVTAACLVMEKKLFNDVGGFDEELFPVAFNDVDLCLKVQALGLRNLWTPYALLYHHESISRGDDVTPEKAKRAEMEINNLRLKWKTESHFDPAYNPNLSLTSEDFSLSRL
ncbi:glycosyltransferase family 2 protein [Thalassotalea agarivorans]|uniref:Glycosyltransferase, GT2 family n=1 Tax=Thalassotalea agarivorans TaxID=349064 RepID=A0A1H9YKK4_THASX|nr:glycosyltransferase family 2 protein [Thalassotalea agarivorans]SES69133.1 Glycosyltransferase, GT2 family [Thalassotalea agarivorans]